MNQTDLTDLNIFMTVPPTMKGQTMRTLPAGGNWNDAQRNVSFGIGKHSMKQYSKLENLCSFQMPRYHGMFRN